MNMSDVKRFIMAFALSSVILFGWQHYFGPRPGERSSNKTETVQTTKVQNNNASVQVANAPNSIQEVKEVQIVQKSTEVKSSISTVNFRSDLVLEKINSTTSKQDSLKIIGTKNPVQIFVDKGQGFVTENFSITETESVLKGVNADSSIEFVIEPSDKEYLAFNLRSKSPVRLRFVFNSSEATLENNQVRNYLLFNNSKVEKIVVGEDETLEGKTAWFGVDFDYHLFAVLLDKKSLFKASTNTKGQMIVDFINPSTSFYSKFIYTRKDYDLLSKLGSNLELSVDFGVFGILAVPILRCLQFLYKYIPNYGIGIILLTILMRLITFPLQYKSFKSMKKMQKIQPQLQKLKEKYKDDPQRMQKETMELFKKAGANPLGGCLPMILQMPIFFAFYQVLYNAVELVDAPFMGWITDLSVKDPIYVLPVLMAASMFLQSKFQPQTSTDPTQKKIMQFMPLIFGFIMKDLPSGLVLYIFVSTVLGMLQQALVYKTTD